MEYYFAKYPLFDRVRFNATFESPPQDFKGNILNRRRSNKGQFEKQCSKCANPLAQNFEQERLSIWNIVSQNVLYLNVYGLMPPLKSPPLQDSKETLNCSWSNK